LAAAAEPPATTSQSGSGERVVRTVEARLSRRAPARRFEVGVSFVIKLVQRWPRQGTVEPERYGGWKRPALAARTERVRPALAAEPDLTIAGGPRAIERGAGFAKVGVPSAAAGGEMKTDARYRKFVLRQAEPSSPPTSRPSIGGPQRFSCALQCWYSRQCSWKRS
jgi:hypothetical protein